MLLTVIAVATLLVAVVGATFAYFSLTVGGTTATTTATAGTGKLPVITLAQGENTLGMTVTAEDMDKTNVSSADKSMWANTSGAGGGSSSGGVWSNDRQNVAIAKLSATNIDDEVTYTCQFTMTITVASSNGEDANMYKALLNDGSSKHTGDLILHLGFKDGTTGTFTTDSGNIVSKEDSSDSKVKIDIANIPKDELESETPTSGKTTVNGTINVSSANTIDGGEAEITAALELVNKNSAPQDYLAGKDIKVTLTTASGGECKVASED